jgi:hypothetical protein
VRSGIAFNFLVSIVTPASAKGEQKAAMIAMVSCNEPVANDLLFSFSPYPIMTRVTAERQIKQNKTSLYSIFVFKKYPLKKMTANGDIFFIIAVNVKDKYLITDYAIFPLIATSKILKKRIVL